MDMIDSFVADEVDSSYCWSVLCIKSCYWTPFSVEVSESPCVHSFVNIIHVALD